jgi:hypothetical protein
MKNVLSLTVFVLVTAGLSAGDAPLSHEEVVKQMLASMDKITMTLTSITNEESAGAAKPGLRKAAKEWVELRAKVEKLPPPPREEKERLDKEYKEKLVTANKKLTAEKIRVDNIPGGPEAIKEIRGVFAKPMK